MNSSKIYVMSDQHFGHSIDTDTNVEKYTFEYFDKFIDDIANTKDDNDICIFCGDLFDNRTLLNSKIYVSVFERIARIASMIKLYIITGNHDMYDKLDNNIASINPLQSINNVEVIKTPMILEHSNRKLALIPYYEHINEFVDKYESLTKGIKVDYVFCHQDILGSCINDEAHQVPIKIFNNAGKVVSGHIHKRHSFKNICFVGTPYPLTFFDSEDKGYHIIDLSNDKPNIEFIMNKISPKFITYTISNEDDMKNINKDEIRNNYVRFIIEKNISPDILKTDVSQLECYKSKFVLKKEDTFNVEANNEDIDYNDLKTDISGEIKKYIYAKDFLNDQTKEKAMEIIIDAYNSIKRKKSNIENW